MWWWQRYYNENKQFSRNQSKITKQSWPPYCLLFVVDDDVGANPVYPYPRPRSRLSGRGCCLLNFSAGFGCVLRSVVNKVVLGAARYVCVCFVNSSVVLLVVLG